jgi:2-C-methyl-D-erythritol 4-phosphate cytidylyltransferase
MAIYSVILLTAPPPGQSSEAGGAYIKIDGRESLLRAVEMFLNRDNVKQLQLVVSQQSVEETRKKFGANLGLYGVKLIAGGGKWIEQIQAAGKNVSADCSHVIIHDTARPAVPYPDIEAAMAESEKSDAVLLATPVRCSLIEVDEGKAAMAYHLPSRFMQVQTPQIFARTVFAQMVKSGAEPHASQMTIVKGSPLNIRVGSAADASFAKAMMAMLPKPKIRAASSPFDEAQW